MLSPHLSISQAMMESLGSALYLMGGMPMVMPYYQGFRPAWRSLLDD